MKSLHIYKYILIIVTLLCLYNTQAQDYNNISDTGSVNEIKRSLNISGALCLGQ